MREQRSHTTPRRRGPKLPVPRNEDEDPYERGGRGVAARFDAGASESPYYTIDNTEDIYGTTLLPSQRCFVDPWDLENYDYVRKKLNASPTSPSGGEPAGDDFYDVTVPTHSPSPPDATPVAFDEEPYITASQYYMTRQNTHRQCEVPCCAIPPTLQAPRRRYDDVRREPIHCIGAEYNKIIHTAALEEHNMYSGYGGFSSSSERQSSIEEEDSLLLPSMDSGGSCFANATTLMRNHQSIRKFEFPAPPPAPLSTTYDYCSAYAALPCSVSDCYECLSSMYGTTAIYGITGGGIDVSGGIYGSRIGRPTSSLYGGIYCNKFGLSQKGLLQIDYECSWNDLGRVMGRNY